MKHFKSLIIRFFILTVAMLFLGTCAGFSGSSLTGILTQAAPSIIRAMEEITPEQEYYIGRAVAANILTMYRVYNGDRNLTMYLNRICGAIVINSPKPYLYNGYHVNILDTDEINAFATSGGHIFLTRGLIACTNSEEALAGVIAHEIAHIQLQHGMLAIKNSRFTQAIVATGAAALDAVGGGLGELTSIFTESVGEIVTTMVSSGYSQAQEFEADNNALSLMAAAGYDPKGLVTMLQVIERNQRDTSGGFGKTHPTPGDRITNVNKTIAQFSSGDTASYRVPRYNNTVR